MTDRQQATMRAPIGTHFLHDDAEVVDDAGWYRVLTPSAPWPSANEVVLSNVGDAEPEKVIDEVLSAYRAHDLPVKWCVYPWSTPADLGERLLRRGAIHWKARGMACDADLEVTVPNGVSAERISNATLRRYTTAMAVGWEMPEAEAAFLGERLARALATPEPHVQLFVAHCDGEVAGSAATWLKEGYGYLMGANVLPGFRGRGLYRALLAARLAALRDAGLSLATTHAREHTSAPMLEHFGFETVFRYELYQLNPR